MQRVRRQSKQREDCRLNCACDGGAGHNDTCYRAMVANGDGVRGCAAVRSVLDEPRRTPARRAHGRGSVWGGWGGGITGRRAWTARGTTARGVLDGCGVCGGDCSACSQTRQACMTVSSRAGPGIARARRAHARTGEDDPWLWPAFNNGTDNTGQAAQEPELVRARECLGRRTSRRWRWVDAGCTRAAEAARAEGD